MYGHASYGLALMYCIAIGILFSKSFVVVMNVFSVVTWILQTSTVQVSQTDIDSLMLRASNALVPVLDKLYEKGFASYRVSKRTCAVTGNSMLY